MTACCNRFYNKTDKRVITTRFIQHPAPSGTSLSQSYYSTYYGGWYPVIWVSFLREIPSTLWVNRVWPQFFSAILSVSGFRWSTNNVEFRYSMCPKLMSPKIKTGRNPALQNKCISHEFRCPRFACLHTTYQITTRSDFRICPLACLGFTNCPIAEIYQSCIEHYSQDS